MIQFLDALTFFFLIGTSIIGFRRGLVEELGRLLGLIVATVFSLKLYVKLGSLLLNWIAIDVAPTASITDLTTFFMSFSFIIFGR